MTTNRTADTGRLTIAEAKRLILESSPRESFVQVYRREDGTLQLVPDAEPKSIFAGHLDEDFAANCAQLGIVPRWKYRPGKTGYAGDPATDELYTISRDELAQLADLHGLTLEGAAPVPEVAGRQSLSEPIAAAGSRIAPLSKASPPPLTTPEIAAAFDGIDGQSSKQWSSKLGDVNNHQWVISARAAKASAPKPATWWPIQFAELLLQREASAESLNRAFLADPKLKAWLTIWQEKRRERNVFGQ